MTTRSDCSHCVSLRQWSRCLGFDDVSCGRRVWRTRLALQRAGFRQAAPGAAVDQGVPKVTIFVGVNVNNERSSPATRSG